MRHSDSLKKRYLWQWYRFTQSSMRLSLEQATKWIDDDIRERLLREYLHALYAYYKRRRRCNTACTRNCISNKYRKGLLKLHKLIVHQRKREKNKTFVISHRIFQSIFYYLKRWRKYLGFKFRHNIYSTQYSHLIALYRLSRWFNYLFKCIKTRKKIRQVDRFSSNTIILKRRLKQWISHGKFSQEIRRYTNQCISKKYLKRWLQFLSTHRFLIKSENVADNSLSKVCLHAKTSAFIKIRQYMNNKMVGKTRLAVRYFHIRLCLIAVNALHRNIYKKRRLLKLIQVGDTAAKKKSALLKRYTYYIFKRFTCESIVNKLKVSQYRQQKTKHQCLVVLFKLQCHRHANCVLLSITKAKNMMYQRNALKSIYLRMKNRRFRRLRLGLFLEKNELRQQLLVINHLRYLVRKSCRIKLLVKGYTQLKHYNSLRKLNFQKIQNSKQYKRRKLLANALWKLYRSWKRCVIARHHLLYVEDHVYKFGMKHSIKKWRKCVSYAQRVDNCRQSVAIMISQNTCCRAIKGWRQLLRLQSRRRLGIALIAACTRAYVNYNCRNSLANWVEYVRTCRLNQQYVRLNQLLVPVCKGYYERHCHRDYSDIHSAVKLYRAKYFASMKVYRRMLQRRVIRLLQIYLRDRKSKSNVLLSLYRQYILKWRLRHYESMLATNHQRGGYVFYKNRLSANTLWQFFQHCKHSKRRKYYVSLSDVVQQMQARRNVKRSMKKLFVAIFHSKRKCKHQQTGIIHFQKSLARKGFGVLFTRLELRKCKQLIEYDVTRTHYEPHLCRRYLLVWISRVRPFPMVAKYSSHVQDTYVSPPQITKVRPSKRSSQFSPSYIRARRLMSAAFLQLYQRSKDRIARRFDFKSINNIVDSNATASYSTPRKFTGRASRRKASWVSSHQVVSNQVYFTDSDEDSDGKVTQTYHLGSWLVTRCIMWWKLYSYRSKCARSVTTSVDAHLQHRLKAIYFYSLLRNTRKRSARQNYEVCSLGWKVSRYRQLLEVLKSKVVHKNKYFLCVRRLKKQKLRNGFYKLCTLVSSWLQQRKSLRRSARFECRNTLGKAIAAWFSRATRRRHFRPNRYKLLIANGKHTTFNHRRGVKAEHPIGIYYRNRLVAKWFIIFARVLLDRVKYRKVISRKCIFLRSKINFSLRSFCYHRWRYQYQVRINKYVIFKLLDSSSRYCDRLQLAIAMRTWKVSTNYKKMYMLLQPYMVGVYQRNYHRELSKVSKYLKWMKSRHSTVMRVRQRHRVAMKRQIFRILIRYKHIQRIQATLSVDLYNQQLALLRWKHRYQCRSKYRRQVWFVRYYRMKKSTSAVWNNLIVMLKHTKKERLVQSVLQRKRLLAAFVSMRVTCKRLISGVHEHNKRTMTKEQHGRKHFKRKFLINALRMYKLNVGYRVLHRGLLVIGGNTQLILSLPRRLQRVLFTLYIHGGNRRCHYSNLNLARYHLEKKRKHEAIGFMSANVGRRRLLRAGRKHHLGSFLRSFSEFFSQRRIARNRYEICCLYHDNSKKSQCFHHWRDYSCGKIYRKRKVTRYYIRRVCKGYLKRIRSMLRGKLIIKRSKRLLRRHQCATNLLKCNPKYILFCRWRRRCDRSRRLASNAVVVSNQFVEKIRLALRHFYRYVNTTINSVTNAMKAIEYLRSKRLLFAWMRLCKRCFYSHHSRHHHVLHCYTKTNVIVRRLQILPHHALASFIRLVLKRKKILLRYRHVAHYRSIVLKRAGYNSLFRYKFHRHKYLRKAAISAYYYTRKLLALYYDRCRHLYLVKTRHNRKVIRYKLRKYFNWYRRGVQSIKSVCGRLRTIRKRAEQSVKLRVFLEWFYLYRQRNYYSYLCEIVYRKRLLSKFNKWIQSYEASKLCKLKNIVQRKCELRMQREYFQSMKFIYLYKKVVISRMQSRKLANALHRLIVFVTTRFIRQKDIRVARKHFIAYKQWKYLRLWLVKHKQKELRLNSMQQTMRKVCIKRRNKHFYYLMSVLSRKRALHRRSFKGLHNYAKRQRLECFRAFFSLLLQRICRKRMKHVAHYLLQWRRYNNFNRLRREIFVQKVNKVYLSTYFIQLRKHTNYHVFKKMAVLYLRLSRQRNYLRHWIVAYQRTVRARVKIMDIFYTIRKNSLKFAFIHWQISATHFVRLQQLHCGGLILHAFRQWFALKNAISYHKKVTLKIYFRRLKGVKVVLYQKQQHLLRKRKGYKIFSAILHRFSTKELARMFHRWRQNTHVSGDYASSRYSTPWKGHASL